MTRLLILGAVILPAGLHAQFGTGSSGGQFTATVSYSYVDGHDGVGESERRWLRAIVIWRHPEYPEGAVPSQPDDRVTRRYRELTAAAQDLQRIPLGGSRSPPLRWAERDETTLYVGGRSFPLPFPPRALVVVVDLGEGADPTPAIRWSGSLAAEITRDFWPRRWRRGDTLLFHPGRPDKSAVLLSHLRTSTDLASLLPEKVDPH